MMAKRPERSDYPSWNRAQFVVDSTQWENDPLYGWCNKNYPLRPRQPGAPDTVRCTTGQFGALDRTAFWLYTANFSLTRFLLFQALRHNTLVFKTMY